MKGRPSGQSRPTFDVASSIGGWPPPWSNVAELAEVLPTDKWTLVGGLMTQLHTVHHGLGAVRPTNDVDIVLHIETSRGVPAATATVAPSTPAWRSRPARSQRSPYPDPSAHSS